jgi:hypothetical protein
MRVMMLKIKDSKGDRDRQSDVQGHAGRSCAWVAHQILLVGVRRVARWPSGRPVTRG